MLSSLTIIPYNIKSREDVSFMGRLPTFVNPIKPPRAGGSYIDLHRIKRTLASEIETRAYKSGKSTSQWLQEQLKILAYSSPVSAFKSVSDIVGNCKVTSVIDGGQIFGEITKMLKESRRFFIIEGFEFQHQKVDGERWIAHGAEKVPGFNEQQALLPNLIRKKQENPDMKMPMILDAHKWYNDSHGRKRHYGNQDMMKFLLEHGFDVVPYPKASQEGAMLQHIKLYAADTPNGGKKVIVTGMNLGTHSAANHDTGFVIESLPGKTSSEVDNIIDEHFNRDMRFSWKKLAETDMVPGPLNEAEQQYYRGLNKEIKPENVDYHKLLSKFFDTPEARARYKNGQYTLIDVHPIEEPKIKVLATKPREYEEIGESGLETIFKDVMQQARTAKKLRGELFFATNKEFRKVIIQRHKAGELDVKLVISETDFPYCKNAYDELVENGVPVRIYKVDKSIMQRMHAKWCEFDDKYIMQCSANFSDQALTQNLSVGRRKDYPLTNEEIEQRIKKALTNVSEHEAKLKISPLKWDGSEISHETLKKRKAELRKIYKRLNKQEIVSFNLDGKKYTYKKGGLSVKVNGKTHAFAKDDTKDTLAELRTIMGYYEIIQKRHLSKPRFKRGNNEIAVAFESPKLAKALEQQFNRDYEYSESKYEKIKHTRIPIGGLSLDTKG